MNIPNIQSVYEIADCNGNEIYIGKGNLRDRLHAHFLTGSDPIPQGCKVRFENTGSKRRSSQRERALLDAFAKQNNGNLPRHNKRKG